MTETTNQSGAARAIAAILALLGWVLLALQLYLSLAKGHVDGKSTTEIITNYFSFFTILGNLLITLIFTSIAIAPPGPGPSLQAAAAVYITIVGAGYSLLLRSVWSPEGLQKLLNIMHHDVMPIVYVLFWIVFARRLRALPWSSAIRWLIAPLIYLAYSIVRGSIARWYPYHFLDPRSVGWPHIFSIIAGFLVAFLALGLATISLTRSEPLADSAEIPLP